MLAELQCIEVEAALGIDDHELAVEHDPVGELGEHRLAQLWEVTEQRLLVARLQIELVAVTEHDAAEAVPLRFVEHLAAGRQLARQLREHRIERRPHWQIHSNSLAVRAAGGGLNGQTVWRIFQIRRRSLAQRASWWRLESWSLRSTDDTCVSTVFTEIPRSRATSLYA